MNRLAHTLLMMTAVSAIAAPVLATPAAAQPTRGPDMTLEAISPTAQPVSVGLAGSDPADIARYVLANGAGAPALSPDGGTIAFRSTITGVPQLWVMPVTGGQPRQITFGNGITFFRWAPDSQSLIYGADNDGNEQESYYRIAVNGGTESIVFPAVAGGFRAFGDFAADGKSIAYASTERNGQDFDIYVADLVSGKARLVLQGKAGFFARALSPDGKSLVVTETVGEDSDNLYLLSVADGTLKTLSKPSPRANHSDGGIVWRADGSGFYFASNVGREFSAVHFYDVASGKIMRIAETARDAGDIQLCGPDDRFLVFVENVDGFHTLHVRDRISGQALGKPALPGGVYTPSCGDNTTKLAIGVSNWKTPGDIKVLDLATGAMTDSYRSNLAGLDPARLVRPESIRIKARDGVELQGLLYLPDSGSIAVGALPPVVFDVHGGPTGQSVAGFDGDAQFLVDRGFAVFQPNVRGSTGFGRTYVTLDDQRKRLDSVRDLIDLLAGLKADGRVDTGRAAVVGGSYGGYMVNAVLAQYPEAFRAGVSLFGVADWVTGLQVASPALKASDRIEYGDITDPQWLEFYTANSPIRLAKNIKVPVLFSHGVMDPRIDIFETETMVKILRSNGVEAPYIRFADEGHGWRKLANRLFYARKQAEFLEQQLAR